MHKGYDYARVGNPTRTALQECIASLEGAAHGRAFSSGLGGATTLMHLLSPGDHVVAVNDVYGGIYRMFTQVYEPKGYRFTFLSPDEISAGLADHLEEQTKLVWLETPTNPALNVIDIAAAATAAHEAGALVVVDNTFATPYLQQPLALGADVVLHSTTKYLGGHSDVVGGFVATNDDAIGERLAFLQKSLGAVPGPFDAWLVLRGVKTLAVRMDRHCANARAVAAFLEGHAAGRRRSCTRASPRIRVTTSPRSRCATSAEWCRSCSMTRARRSSSSPAPASGSSPRASAASRASSSTPHG